ncbi:S8 family peptidase [Bacillus wiedmannii]|uniref:S8 family peptidase n=1 Tax=Bacillus wiedmannii TaxID=1890302 RepID=UPI000D08AF36|nr:S8 family serine peptidase [Bacillus wiedmannii]PRT15097.1 peptidase [Bacillus wiedmannii]
MRNKDESPELVNILVEVRAPGNANEFAAMSGDDIHSELNIDLTSFEVDKNFKPVLMRKGEAETARTLENTNENSSTLIISGKISKNKIEILKQQENVIDVFLNPKGVIAPMADAVDCESGQPKGNINKVISYLGVDKIWEKGIKGDNIVIGIVDAGITAEGRANPSDWTRPLIKRVIGGFREDWGTYTNKLSFHGNMTATDALGMAPNAKVFDIRIFEKAGVEATFVDVVIQAYEWAIQQFRRNGTPQILSNSWGFLGSFPGVTDNMNHPMNRKILEAINAGILVLFSAGNCGGPCPSSNCIDTGPGNSIHGMNGHKLVMSVGAANMLEVRAGYSAQGPANFDEHKPDFCAPTHFTGYLNSDNGTSASCPVAAGVVALLKQAKPNLTQEQIKKALIDTAINLEEPGWDSDTGAGMIQANAAFNHLMNPN